MTAAIALMIRSPVAADPRMGVDNRSAAVEDTPMSNRKSTGPKQSKPRTGTTILLDPQDRAAIEAIRKSGWAKTTAGAVRFALKLAADKVAA